MTKLRLAPTACLALVLLAGCTAEIRSEDEPLDAVSLAASLCPSFTATNSQHVTAARAYTRTTYSWFRRTTTYYARGTDQNLGTSGSTTTTLYAIAAGTYSTSDGMCTSGTAGSGGAGGTGGAAGAAGTGGTGGAAGMAGSAPPPPNGSQGCGLAPPASGSKGPISIAGVNRSYVLSVPSGYDRTRAYPLVLAFHGMGSSGSQAQLYFGVQQASAGQAVIVYPNAATRSGVTQWGLYGTASTEDLAFTDAVIADVKRTLCVDGSRIFATGHSSGGYFSNTLGCARGNVLRAIAPVAGGGPFVTCDGGQVAAWLYAAQDDQTVSYTSGQQSRDRWLSANHCTATTQPVGPGACVAYQGCDTGHPVRWCLEATGGHGWPSYGGSAIWSFFSSL